MGSHNYRERGPAALCAAGPLSLYGAGLIFVKVCIAVWKHSHRFTVAAVPRTCYNQVSQGRWKETFPGMAALRREGDRMDHASLMSALEHIRASRKIYSWKRLFQALLFEDPFHKLLFAGEFFWHMSIRADLKKQLPYLRKQSDRKKCSD